MEQSDCRELLDEMWALYYSGEDDRLVSQLDAAWPELQPRVDAFVAEACRLAMVACRRLGRADRALVWKVRSLSRHFRAGSAKGVAILVMTESFRVEDTDSALQILEEMKALTDAVETRDPAPLSLDMLRRVYHEKRAFAMWKAGDYAGAAADYEQGLEFCRDEPRGWAKVTAAQALCEYLADPGSERGRVAIETTRRVAESGRARPELRWVSAVAAQNLRLMESGALLPSEFQPYEVT